MIMNRLLLAITMTSSLFSFALIEGTVVSTQIDRHQSLCETRFYNGHLNTNYIVIEELSDCFYTRNYKVDDYISITQELVLEDSYISIDGETVQYYAE